ncbi:TlpA disulfide reductase family protein [Chitinophaga pinensis]|uniref:AhpC/TSA family protein n=1 Tax=Chitinophaga pinensis TaxID=79329 RepID=A0A5C6LUX0_9BACT|nr:TlpA disulfide reductase family protein [Chitinophaga pinensis]TWW01003.1 AhpC/TSA family protein [Chitinophaga pinensis]
MNIVFKRSLLALSLFIPVVIHAQTKDFRLIGKFKNARPHTKVYLVILTGGEKWTLDSTTVNNGGFVFKGKIDDYKRAFVGFSPAFDGSSLERRTIFLEPGDTFINSDGPLSAATFPGSKLNNDFTIVEAERQKYSDADDSLHKIKYTDGATQHADRERLERKYDQFRKEYIRKNPDSYFSQFYVRELLENKQISPLQADSLYKSYSSKYKAGERSRAVGTYIDNLLSMESGRPAPAFTCRDLNGKPVSLSDYRGKYLLLEFWASWCGPCRAESPNLKAAYDKYKNANFTILSISVDKEADKAKWLKAIEQDGTGAWTHVAQFQSGGAKISELYAIPHLPFNVLIDPSGKIIAKELLGAGLFNTLQKLL